MGNIIPEKILVDALYEIANGTNVNERDEMIDTASNVLCEFMEAEDIRHLGSMGHVRRGCLAKKARLQDEPFFLELDLG